MQHFRNCIFCSFSYSNSSPKTLLFKDLPLIYKWQEEPNLPIFISMAFFLVYTVLIVLYYYSIFSCSVAQNDIMRFAAWLSQSKYSGSVSWFVYGWEACSIKWLNANMAYNSDRYKRMHQWTPYFQFFPSWYNNSIKNEYINLKVEFDATGVIC